MTDSRSLLTDLPFGFPGKIFRSPMPFSPFDPAGVVWGLYGQKGVGVVVVLAEKQEYLVQARRDLVAFYHAAGLGVVHLPIPDFHPPQSVGDFNSALHQTMKEAQRGKHVAVHCMAGVGRTGLFLSCLAKARFGFNGAEAVEWVRKYIPHAVESELQQRFVHSWTPVPALQKEGHRVPLPPTRAE